ncbi:malate synthase A [Streptomyces sp. ODS28]|uniref:malate synthase A n=1 Tax=Streptomyces sp. ODS28 TaxID=3136688 RepID=UPI0031EDECEE
MPSTTLTRPVEVLAPHGDRHDEILTPEALAFLGRLHAAFEDRRRALLTERRRRALRLASGEPLDFSVATAGIREDPHWRVAPPAPGLTDRRVEIFGQPTREAAARALASGAQVWMADFEDATSPTWENVIGGQVVLRDLAVYGAELPPNQAGLPAYGAGSGDRGDAAAQVPPTTVVRPRGWHLTEEHLRIDGRALSAALVDFGLYFFHCAQHRIDAGSGPYFYLPKLENHYEARLWNDVFVLAQDLLGIPRGTVRATVLIETITAAFEMEEILHELREHSAGLNAGRWDYLFSLVKNFAHRPDYLLPDRSRLTMTAPFMRAYTDLLVRTCHKRGAHALGGLAAQLPASGPGAEPHAREAALAAVRLDKEREAEDGFDGSAVVDPALVPTCRAVFDGALAGRPHQIERTRDDVHITARDLLAVRRTAGPPTEEGIRADIAVALRYIDAWLRGSGEVPLEGEAADASTAEIARCHLWQWLRHGATDPATVHALLDRECAALAKEDPGALTLEARSVLERAALSRELPAYFTTEAYAEHLVRATEGAA